MGFYDAWTHGMTPVPDEPGSETIHYGERAWTRGVVCHETPQTITVRQTGGAEINLHKADIRKRTDHATGNILLPDGEIWKRWTDA